MCDIIQAPRLETSTIYQLLSNQLRRNLLHLLEEHESMTVGEVALNLANQAVDADQRLIKISLRHHHLPILCEHDVIQMEGERIVLGSTAHELTPYLALDDSLS